MSVAFCRVARCRGKSRAINRVLDNRDALCKVAQNHAISTVVWKRNKGCFRACRVLQSRPVPCNVEQRRAINRIAPRSCHFLRVSCVASVSVAFCRVARSRAMLSNAVRSAQPRFSVSRVARSRAMLSNAVRSAQPQFSVSRVLQSRALS